MKCRMRSHVHKNDYIQLTDEITVVLVPVINPPLTFQNPVKWRPIMSVTAFLWSSWIRKCLPLGILPTPQEPRQDLTTPRLPRCAKKYCANVSRTKFNIPDIDQEKCLNGKGDDKPSEEPPVKSDVPPEATTPDTDKGKSDDEPSEEPLVTSDVPAEATALDTDKGKGDDEQSEEPLVPSDVPPNSTTLATCKGKARASMGFSNGTSVIIPSPANITNPRPTTPPFGAPISNLITATTPTVRPATQSAPTASPSPNAVGPTAALCGGGSIAIVAVMLAAAAAGALL